MPERTSIPVRPGLLRTCGASLAAIVAVPVACLAATLVIQVWLLLTQWRMPMPSDLAFLPVFAAPVGAAGVVLLGLPAAALLQRRGRTSAREFVLCGTVLGAAPFVLYALGAVGYEVVTAVALRSDDPVRIVSSLLSSARVATLWLALFVWCGGCAALAYWRVIAGVRKEA